MRLDLLIANARVHTPGERAMDSVKDHLGPASVDDLVSAIGGATGRLAAQGITSLVEAGVGQLRPGRRADLVLLDEDPFVTELDRLAAIRVAATVMDGRATFDPDAIIEEGP